MKNVKETFTDPGALLKFFESIVCFAGLIFFQFGTVFYARWVQEMLVISLEGFFLISFIFFIMSVRDESIPPMTNFLFVLTGTVLNIVGGAMTIVRYEEQDELLTWMYIEPGLESDDTFEVLTGAFAIAAGVIMLLDTVRSAVAVKRELRPATRAATAAPAKGGD